MTTRSGQGNSGAGLLRPRNLLLLLVYACVVFASGWQLAKSLASADAQKLPQVREALAVAEQRVEALERELDALRTRSEVDRQSLELVRQEMVAQKQYTTELEEDLRFYRSLMSPESAKGQLRVRAPEIVSTGADRRYTYRVVLYQEAAKHQLVRGSLSLKVHGLQDGASAVHSFADIGEPGGEEWPAVKFRYFQAFSGTLALPAGFEPGKVEVAVTASKPRKMEAREEFPWQTEEQVSNVGQ